MKSARPNLLVSLALALLMLAFTPPTEGEKIWMDNSFTPCKKGKATHFMIISEKNQDALYPIELYTTSGILKMAGLSMDEEGGKFHGDFIFYHPNGKVESKGKYLNHAKVGAWERFDQEGNPRAERWYASFDHRAMAYTYVEEMPQFEGGEKKWQDFVKLNLTRYVSQLEDANETMEVQFIVSEKGHIEDVKMLKGLSSSFDEQATYAIQRMTNWTPGKKQGKPVRVLMTMPIKL